MSGKEQRGSDLQEEAVIWKSLLVAGGLTPLFYLFVIAYTT